MKMENGTYSVNLHKFHGGGKLYEGRSLSHAIRIARKHDCTKGGQCVAGPIITNNWSEETLAGWEATPPFQKAGELNWY